MRSHGDASSRDPLTLHPSYGMYGPQWNTCGWNTNPQHGPTSPPPPTPGFGFGSPTNQNGSCPLQATLQLLKASHATLLIKLPPSRKLHVLAYRVPCIAKHYSYSQTRLPTHPNKPFVLLAAAFKQCNGPGGL